MFHTFPEYISSCVDRAEDNWIWHTWYQSAWNHSSTASGAIKGAGSILLKARKGRLEAAVLTHWH
jgi:hypothetical protein